MRIGYLLLGIWVLSSLVACSGHNAKGGSNKDYELPACANDNGFIGLRTDDNERVAALFPGSPATIAGLQLGDEIVDWKPADSYSCSWNDLSRGPIGKKVWLRIRGGKSRRVFNITLTYVAL